MAYERQTDTTKSDQNTKLLADSLDAAVNGAINSYNEQVTAADNESESSFQALVAAGNMSLADQLAYRQNQLKGTSDPATRATIRTNIATLKAQVNQKAFSDGYTVQLQQNAAGIESIQAIVSWLQGQLATATDQTVIDKINTELVTQQGNLFNSTQKTLTDQTNYAKNSGNMTTIQNQITALASAKSTALLDGDEATAANLDLQIQDLQNFVTVQNITATMQNLATSTVTGSSSATDLLNAYQGQISGADTSTPITINGVAYPSAQAFWTQTRDSFVADTGSAGLFSRITKENTDMVQVKSTNNTLSTADLTAINSQFATLGANPILAPFAAQLATAKAASIQAAADALAQVVENKYDQSLDLNGALASLQAIAATGANVDKTTQSVLNSASQTQSQAVQSIMSAANNILAGNPGMSITTAVTQAVASGAGAIVSNNDLLSKTPAATATDQLTKDAAGTATNPTSTTINSNTPPGTPGATPTSTPSAPKTYTIKSGDTLSAIAAANNTTVAALAEANKIGNPDLIQAGATITIPAPVSIPSATPTSAAPAYTPSSASGSPTGSIDYTLHSGESIDQYTTRIAAARVAANPTPAASAPAPAPTASPASSGSAPTVDYTLHIGESIDQYGARVAAQQAALNAYQNPPRTAAPTPSSPSPSSTSPSATPPKTTPSSSTPAAQILRSSDPYNPPAGLTKTTDVATSYSDGSGNIYKQTSSGVYTLQPK